MQRVGFIGLGLMGKSIARNILKAGYPMVVFDRNAAPIEELVLEGAQKGTSAANVADNADFVFSSLPDSPDVEGVVFGQKGIIETVREGMIFIDHSSIKPASARLIAKKLLEKGVLSLDAPVSGGDIGARNGTLAIMVGGAKEALDAVMPIFSVIGKTITHVGEAGAGQIAKAANQIMVAAQMVGMAELLVFAQKAGADPQKVVDAIKGGAAQCWTLDVKTPRLFAGNRQPGFKAYMQAKDMNIILDTAREYGIPLLAAGVHAQLFEAMKQLDMGELDNSAVVGVLEKLTGITLLENHE